MKPDPDGGVVDEDRGRVARVYDRIAPFYDWYEAPMDRFGGRDRRARGVGGAHGKVLEVGVGTGRNLDLYPEGARKRAATLGRPVELRWADVEALPFEDRAFDAVTATCVFCSVEDPVQGLREIRRVVRQNGEVRLLEHVRPRNPVLGKVFDWLSPLTRRLFGPEINRRTEENVRKAGLEIVEVKRDGIWREMVARPGAVAGPADEEAPVGG
jgi:ubiquinone/menaquinone biosynthesis C-methylase UbiE